jgi:hypothetical protein
VVKSSTKSSLLVDQGSCNLSVIHFRGVCLAGTYVADVDDRSGLAARGGKVSERVGRSRCSRGASVESTRRSTTETAAKATATTELLLTEATTTAHETSTARELLAEAAATTHKAAATTAEARWTSETIFSDLEDTAVPVVSVELLDSNLGIIGVVESDNTGTLHATIGGDMNVSTDDSASVSYTER